MSDVILESRHVTKSYSMGRGKLDVLKGVDLTIISGEAVCIVGASGAGKSTLLHILGTLDQPTSGEVYFYGEDAFEKSDKDLARFRNENMGFVFQFHHLLNEFNAVENVMMPCRIGGMGKKESRRLAEELLSRFGLSDRKNHFPTELSGGEQQRVAIARALIRRPKVLFADEPTGNLDTENSRKIQKLFFELKEDFGVTLVVVTHDREFSSSFPRVLTIKDGLWV